ncbi:hypothetical protein JCM3770_002908 [Rhodotorula araucariae]
MATGRACDYGFLVGAGGAVIAACALPQRPSELTDAWLCRAPTILDYHSDCPTFALAISPLSSSLPASLKLAVGSYSEARAPAASIAALSATSNSSGANGAPPASPPGGNNLTIAGLSPGASELDDASDSESETAYVHRGTRQRVPAGGSAFVPLARAPLLYPPSAVRFAPARLSSSLAAGGPDGAEREVLATSTECLRLWDLVGEQDDGAHGRAGNGFVGSAGQPQSRSRLVSRATLQNAKADFSAPLTGFSWSELEPTKIVTSSIDTTCTVWDISTGVPVTQLIAHDREVYDVAWSPASRDIFASVGADGSVRMFDLRSLEHSTILYEAAPAGAPQRGGTNYDASTASPPSGGSSTPAPLLRLAFSPTAPAYVAVVHADSADVQILDTRNPGAPAFEIRGHRAPVNGLTWGGGIGNGQGGETSGPGWLATVGDDANLLLWDLCNAQPPQPPSRSVPQQPKPVSHPTLAYTAPSEINAVAWGGGGDWVTIGCGRTVRTIRTFAEHCPIYAPFFGAMGCTAAIVFTCLGASYGTAKSGVGIAAMGVLRPDLMMKCIIPVVMAGIIAIYGLVVSVLISGGLESPMALYSGFIQLGAGLSVGLAGLSAGFAIGIVGDAGVRGVAQQGRVFVGMVLCASLQSAVFVANILIFAEVLGLYGLIVALILNTRAAETPGC